ncbi:MAG TPA: CUAEP/CCAEP-tail radical SAM protein [Gemmatimonadales bacterium]|nr:CUAEP/CCAEP-tail radical SAM protein [Gemmatimonadales bacterium]
MREPGAILLVSCYELGHQPLGVAWPQAFLEQAGYAPDSLDLAVEPFDEAKVRRARLVGIAVPMHTALRLGVRAAERVRHLNPGCRIVFYGLYALLNARYLLDRIADAVFGGEFEGALVALAERLEAGFQEGAPPPPPPPPTPTLERLSFPVPSRAALPTLTRYVSLARRGELIPAGYVEASRGCLHRCLHCPIPPVYGGRFFAVPRDIVLADIRRLAAAGAGHVTFGDPDFLNGPGHALKLVRALHAEFADVTYDFTAKIEHILEHRELFAEFAATGCVFVVSAVESLSDVVLANLEKGHTRADVAVALDIVRRAGGAGEGITLRPSFVAFTPWTTLDDYLDVLDFVEAKGLIDQVDPVQYTIRLLIPPGSGLLSRPAIRPFLEGLDPAAFTYRWRHPDLRMDQLHREVSALVEDATGSGEDPGVTFYRLRSVAAARAGEHRVRGAVRLPPPERPIPPRLTEPWFC